MKRSQLKAGAKSLARGSTFEKRRHALTRAAKPKTTTMRRASHAVFFRLDADERCVICGGDPDMPHHIITQQKIDEVAPRFGLDPDQVVGDHRNRLVLCRRHHAAHHSRSRPVTWQVLQQHAPRVFRFARELGLSWWLEQTYPQDPTRGTAA